MRIEFIGDGRIFDGTPKQIVKQMQSLAFSAQHLPFAEYVAWCVQNTFQGFGVELHVKGDTDEALATSYLEEIVDKGYARRL